MKLRFISISTFFLLIVVFTAANRSNAQKQVELISENFDEVVIRFFPGDVQFEKVKTQWGTYDIPFIESGTSLLKPGYPELSKLTTSVIIPATGSTSLEIISSEYYEILNIDICPSKGDLLRTVNPSEIPYSKGKMYSRNEFWPSSVASVRDPYILRDYRGQAIVVVPFAYNPVSRILRVYTSITVKLQFKNTPGMNELKNRTVHETSYEFARIYENHFLNFGRASKYTPVEEDGSMLIICYGSFMQAMEPFVTWKNQKGIPCQIVDAANIGGSANIKSYVANYYNSFGLTYLLLVGDHAQVPASSTSAGPSDNNYAYIVGNDNYPDIFVGRFSAENIAHVVTQVQRSVQYEKYPQSSANWYKKGIGIASQEGPGHNNLYDYQHIQLLRSKLLAYTYSNVTEHYEGTQGGLDLPGDPTASQVQNDLNPGAGIILYTGHGWDQGWGTSGYSNTEVNQLTNANKLPFIWAVACVNGNFTTTTCFAEAWLRATSGEQPTGAIATMMSTINQSWNPPMSGQLEMVNILVESYLNNIKRSFGGISMNGCMKMNDEYGSGGYAMTDTWALFGDPSIIVRTDNPGPMTVTHPQQAIIGSSSIDVQCNINNALVCLSRNGVILGRGYISGGYVSISFPALSVLDPIDVVVTAYNKETYLGQILVIPPNGPYVIRDNVIINDAAGNNNGFADFGENIQLNVTLKNIGIDPASNVSATLSCTNSNITITSANSTFGNINAGATETVNNAFAFTVAGNIPDQDPAIFAISATNGSEIWTSGFSFPLNAPVLGVQAVQISDPSGNQNNRIDPGETVNITFNTMNSGHAVSPQATAILTSNSPYVIIINPSVNAGVISPSNSVPVTFQVTISPSTPVGTPLDFSFTCSAASYSVNKAVVFSAGLIVEDWETNNFTSFPWNTTNTGNAPWQIVSSGTIFEGNFAARSGVISDDQQSILSVTLNVISDDTISFYKKVSCENGSQYGQWWDFLAFYINNTEKGKWDGDNDWSREAYYVTSGSKTFKWMYSKDYIVSEGEDAAWIDFVVFPPIQPNVSIDEPSNISHYITCYPNPSTDIININFGLASGEVISVDIIDAQGKIVRTLDANFKFIAGNYSRVVHIHELPAGQYYLRLVSADALLSHPFVIVK